MKSMRSVSALAATLLVILLAFAGCGGSDDSTSGATAAGGEGTESESQGGAGETVKVGTIASLANIGGVFNGYNAGVKAFFEYWNDQGGIDGYTFDLTAKDDGGDPNQSSQDARTLVQEGVVAIVGEASLADAATQKYFEAQNIPVVGGWATSSAWHAPATNMFVNLEGPNAPYCTVWSNETAKAMDVESLVVIAQDFPAAIQDAECREAGAKSQGIEIAGDVIKASLTQADYTPLVRQAIDTGADAIYFSTGADAQIAGIEAAERLGYEGIYIPTQPSGLLKGLSKISKQLDGRVITSALSLLPNDPADYSDELKAFQDGMAKFQPDFANEIPAVSGWAAGVLFADALREVGPDSEAILEYLQGLTDYDFRGLQGPTSFTEGSKPNECTLPLVLENEEWVRAVSAEEPPAFNCFGLLDKEGNPIE